MIILRQKSEKIAVFDYKNNIFFHLSIKKPFTEREQEKDKKRQFKGNLPTVNILENRGAPSVKKAGGKVGAAPLFPQKNNPTPPFDGH